MKVVIVGLPLFAKRLKDGLTSYDLQNKYTHLDTYYNKVHKIKAALQVPRADCVFSINGTIISSGVFDLALKKNIPLVMNWVGTDVLKAIDAYKTGTYQQLYIDKAIHFCEVLWIQEELKEIGIKAEIVNFAAFNKSYELRPVTGNQLNVLSYVSDTRPDFYGMSTIIEMAIKLPEVNFIIAGTKGDNFKPLPDNMEALGWINDMNELFDKAHVCLRYTEHDGLSNFILESMARGKQVLYKNAFNYCKHCPSEETLLTELKELTARLKRNESLVNTEAAEFIKSQFSEDVIFGGLIKKITKIVNER